MSLWPIHPQPYHDELLSSWLVRMAHANGVKVQTFCHLVFDQRYEVWNRDIDRLAPDWLLHTIQVKTGQPLEKILNTTLRTFQNKLYDKYRASGQLSWITTLQIYHRKRLGYGLQFCPQCLAEDDEPYFRKSWRVALHTFCPKHRVLMHDRCPACGEGVAFHRQDLGKQNEFLFDQMSICWRCRFDLSKAVVQKMVVWDDRVFNDWQKILLNLPCDSMPIDRKARDQLKITHHFMAVLFSLRLAPRLHVYLCTQTGQNHQEIRKNGSQASWENRSVIERHHMLGLCWWLMGDYPSRLLSAWQDKAIRYNHMLKDFDDCPESFSALIQTLNRSKNKSHHSKRMIGKPHQLGS